MACNLVRKSTCPRSCSSSAARLSLSLRHGMEGAHIEHRGPNILPATYRRSRSLRCCSSRSASHPVDDSLHGAIATRRHLEKIQERKKVRKKDNSNLCKAKTFSAARCRSDSRPRFSLLIHTYIHTCHYKLVGNSEDMQTARPLCTYGCFRAGSPRGPGQTAGRSSR